MEPVFPVFVLEKDNDEVLMFESLDAMGYLEAIDVEANEYLAWDCNGTPLDLIAREPRWLFFEEPQSPDPRSLSEALERYASLCGVPSIPEDPVPPQQRYRQIQEALKGKTRKKRRPLFLLSEKLEEVVRGMAISLTLFYAFCIYLPFAYWSLLPSTFPKEANPLDLYPTAVLGAWMLLIAHFALVRKYGRTWFLSFIGFVPAAMRSIPPGRETSPIPFMVVAIVACCAYFLMSSQQYKRKIEMERAEVNLLGPPTDTSERTFLSVI